MDTHALAATEPPPERAPEPGRWRPLRVGVLVDLPIGPGAGGHVRCWERLAEAALRCPDALDLTVHFSGLSPERRALGDTVRYVIDTPIFSTERIPFLSHVPDHTDLAPSHPRLARLLPRYDVIHTTDAYFAYARTALRFGERWGVPIVNSIHTNTPEYARIFTAPTIERLFCAGAAAHLLLRRLRVAQCVEAHMSRQLARYQSRCAFALVSRPEQLDETSARLGGRTALLRRGVDHRLFDPAKRDRPWLAATYGIPTERFVVFCAGRINRAKNMSLLAEAVAMVAAAGIDVHLACAGDGDERAAILRRLGARATCPGSIEPAQLARLYAAADLFAFPSCIEESANVVLEAMASGLPTLVTREGGMGRTIVDGMTGLVLPGDGAAPWAAAVAVLAGHPARARTMGHAARKHAERTVPSWSEVLMEDLLPQWDTAARRRHATTARATP